MTTRRSIENGPSEGGSKADQDWHRRLEEEGNSWVVAVGR